MSFNSQLYPWFATFATREEALAYAEELAGYRQLWEAIAAADLYGVISPN